MEPGVSGTTDVLFPGPGVSPGVSGTTDIRGATTFAIGLRNSVSSPARGAEGGGLLCRASSAASDATLAATAGAPALRLSLRLLLLLLLLLLGPLRAL